MQHYVIKGRIYRVLELAAADVHEATRHISAERPISAYEQRLIRRAAE